MAHIYGNKALDAINQKILDLETKKHDLELRDSKKLYKSTQHILGERLSSVFVLRA